MESTPKSLESEPKSAAATPVQESADSSRRPSPILDLPAADPAASEEREDLREHLAGLSKGHENDFRASSMARRLLRHSHGGRALDAGCGTGILSLALLRRGQPVTAVDQEEEMVVLTRDAFAQNGFEARTRALPLEELDQLGHECFDEVYCCDVIEHVPDDDLALTRLHGVLAPGGRLILTVPAWPFLYGERDRRMGHYRRYSRRMLSELFERSDFDVKSIRWWNLSGFLLNALAIKLLKLKPSESFRYARERPSDRLRNWLLNRWFHLFENHVPVPFGLTLIVVADKRPDLEGAPAGEAGTATRRGR